MDVVIAVDDPRRDDVRALLEAHLAFSRALARVRKGGETALAPGALPRLGRVLVVPANAAPRAPFPL